MKKMVAVFACLIPVMASAAFNPQSTDSKGQDVLGFEIVSGVESNKRIEFFNEEETLSLCPNETFGHFMKKATDFDVSIYRENGIYGYKMTFTVNGDRIDSRPRPIAFYVPSTYGMGSAVAPIRAVVEFNPEGTKYQVLTPEGRYLLNAICQM